MKSQKEKFVYTEEDFKRVSKELRSIYESNKEYQKEAKKYKQPCLFNFIKSDLKKLQQKEQDYLSLIPLLT
jgi:hypothetical protein